MHSLLISVYFTSKLILEKTVFLANQSLDIDKILTLATKNT